jgi:hypothetical protein
MATFNSIFPTFLTDCAGLNTLLLNVAYALFIVGVIVTVSHRFTHRSLLNLLMRLLLLTSLLVFLPAWGNQIQQLLQDSILSGSRRHRWCGGSGVAVKHHVVRRQHGQRGRNHHRRFRPAAALGARSARRRHHRQQGRPRTHRQIQT